MERARKGKVCRMEEEDMTRKGKTRRMEEVLKYGILRQVIADISARQFFILTTVRSTTYLVECFGQFLTMFTSYDTYVEKNPTIFYYTFFLCYIFSSAYRPLRLMANSHLSTSNYPVLTEIVCLVFFQYF
jgi:hypothetical protein